MNLPFLDDMKNHQKTMQHSSFLEVRNAQLRRMPASIKNLYAKNLQVMFWDD